MWLMGYWMERGYRPEEILSLSRDERLIYQAVAELNEQKRNEDFEAAMMSAMAGIINRIFEKR